MVPTFKIPLKQVQSTFSFTADSGCSMLAKSLQKAIPLDLSTKILLQIPHVKLAFAFSLDF